MWNYGGGGYLMVGKLPRYEYIFNDLDVSILPIDNPCIVTIKKDGVLFDFLIRLKPFSKKLLVFGSGAYDPRKMSSPIFQRHTWINYFEESIIPNYENAYHQ